MEAIYKIASVIPIPEAISALSLVAIGIHTTNSVTLHTLESSMASNSQVPLLFQAYTISFTHLSSSP